MRPSIDVVIVNYRSGPLVVDCLESLEAERAQLPHLRAIVVDNLSPDGSGDLIEAAIDRRGWADWITLIRSPRNGGFGAGNNIGMEAALAAQTPAELIWLLNPDTRVVPGAAQELIRFMATHPRCGIAGSALLEGNGRPWPFAFRFPTALGELERGIRLGLVSRLLKDRAVLRRMGEQAERVDWVSGASFVVRRELLETGLRFDEHFFLYYEETDFCLQARKAGWESWYVPDAIVLHIAGQSTGVTGAQAAARRLPDYWFQSRQYYFAKNHGRLYGMIADLSWIVAHIAAKVKAMFRRSPEAEPDPPRLLSDFIRHSSLMPRR